MGTYISSFDRCRLIEKRSRAILEPMLEKASDGRFVYTDKGRLATEFQKKYGDVLLQERRKMDLWSLELKAEEKPMPNLFLEHWSNRSLNTEGWMFHLESDLLFYHFLNSDELYIIRFPHLKRWYHTGEGFNKEKRKCQYRPACERFPLKQQRKYQQMNDTWGTCVPIDAIYEEVGLKKVNPLGLFKMNQAA